MYVHNGFDGQSRHATIEFCGSMRSRRKVPIFKASAAQNTKEMGHMRAIDISSHRQQICASLKGFRNGP